jgi:hypothetical protein
MPFKDVSELIDDGTPNGGRRSMEVTAFTGLLQLQLLLDNDLNRRRSSAQYVRGTPAYAPPFPRGTHAINVHANAHLCRLKAQRCAEAFVV